MDEKDAAKGVKKRGVNNLNESRGVGVGQNAERTKARRRQEVGKRAGKETEGEESETAVCAW